MGEEKTGEIPERDIAEAPEQGLVEAQLTYEEEAKKALAINRLDTIEANLKEVRKKLGIDEQLPSLAALKAQTKKALENETPTLNSLIASVGNKS